MVYIGHFSFDEITYEARFGHFTCVVEAKSPEEAEKGFRKLIKDMRKNKALFSTTPIDIYLDSFTEVGEVPKTGLVSCFSSFSGEKRGSISTYLPHEDKGTCQGFFYYSDDKPEMAVQMDKTEPQEVEPFISFKPTAAQEKAMLAREEYERMKSRPVVPEKRKPFTRKSHW